MFVAYVTSLHPLEHKGAYAEDKFYLRPGSHVTVHGGAMPIQQPPQVRIILYYTLIKKISILLILQLFMIYLIILIRHLIMF